MSELTELSPQYLWQLFAKICSIPHPSYHEEQLAQYILDWANERNIHIERDQAGNILLRKPATAGMEKRQPVILQAHLDMVPQKNSDTQHDFSKDPIQAYVDGEWVRARGTTLGADNGIGMASALAVLADPSVSHGPLEVLLTMTEEAGMDGAFALQPDWLQGEVLINTDSEQEGEIYMGCAGGIDATATLSLSRIPLPTGHQTYKITLKGLTGGHSGCDIHLGRGNANKLLAYCLSQYAAELQLKLIDFHGGTLRNAIPREAFATIAVPVHHSALLQTRLSEFTATLQAELAYVEKNINIHLASVDSTDDIFDENSQQRFLSLLNAMPNGVIRMNDEIKSVVETSLNVGIVSTQQQQVEIICLIRSLVDSGKEYVISMLHSLGYLAGASVTADGSYPGWKPDPHSSIMQTVRKTYQQLFDSSPDIMVIHAGLECGLFKTPYPHLDMVSIGPTIRSPHSPDERVHIPSVDKYWQLLTALLKAIPEKK